MPGSGGWSGGQYSLVRAVSGLALCAWFWVEALTPGGVSSNPALLLVVTILSLLLVAGAWDRIAALGLLACSIWAQESGGGGSGTGFPAIGWGLIGHALLPGAPFGSWRARGRPDPDGGWRVPGWFSLLVWAVLAAGYAWMGLSRLTLLGRGELLLALPGLLEFAFGPLALSRRLRPWVWAAGLTIHSVLLVSSGLPDPGPGLLLLHIFTFDPAWFAPFVSGVEERLFYDGGCGLCHASVRFVLAEDRSGKAFRFAPLGERAHLEAMSPADRAAREGTLVVRRADGSFLTRAAAVRHVLERLGGLWRGIAIVSRALPLPVLDRLYGAVASVRRRIFRAPGAACPAVADSLRGRFDA